MRGSAEITERRQAAYSSSHTEKAQGEGELDLNHR